MTGGAKPRLAVVGVGIMGSYHARVIAASERCELALVVEIDPEVGQPVAQRYGCDWAPELDSTTGLDGVVVAVPTELHPPLVQDMLTQGVPVLVEKPVSATLAETEQIVALAEQVQVPIMCGFVERFNPAILTVAPLVDEPIHITATRHSPYTGRIRIGVTWDLLIHDVDFCLRLVGQQPITVRSGLGQFHPGSLTGGEDVAEAVMMFSPGTVASASASRIGQRKIRTVSIAELGRTIELDLLRRDVTIYRHVSAEMQTQGGVGYRQQTIIEIPELVSAREPLAAQLDHFLNLIDGRADLAAERGSILPPHQVIATVARDPV